MDYLVMGNEDRQVIAYKLIPLVSMQTLWKPIYP